jgi:anti-sigma factor RsiW
MERHLDGMLRPWAARRVAAHLESCPACRSRAEGFSRIRALVQASVAEVAEPDWAEFWSTVHGRILRETPRPVRDAWWLPLWKPFWGHPRLAVGSALAAGLAVTLLFWSGTDNTASLAWAEPVIVQDVSTQDPDRSVMLYASSDQTLTVIWLFNSPAADES